jgi:preprotein translocase SecE subunit
VNNNWIHIAIWAAVIGGVFGLLWWQGQIQRLAVYVAETREELKKCAWPSWEELKGSTALIMIMVALLGGFVVGVDLIFTKTFPHPLVQAVGILGVLAAGVVYKSMSSRQ